MEFDLKWVHMARYELILRLDGALWLTIISKPLLTLQRATKSITHPKLSNIFSVFGPRVFGHVRLPKRVRRFFLLLIRPLQKFWV